MNKAEKVEALEALLSRIQTNAATARAPRQQLAVAPAPARSLSPVRTPAVVAPTPAPVAQAPAPSPAPAPVRALSPARGTPAARVDTGRPEPVADRAAPKPLRMPFSGATPTPAAARASDPAIRAAAPSAAPAGGGGLRIPSPRASEPGRPAAPKRDPHAARLAAAEPALDLPIVGASAPASSPRKPEFVDEPTIERAPEAASLDAAAGRRPAAPAFETGVVTAPVVDIAPASGSPAVPPPSSRRPAFEAPAPAAPAELVPEPVAAPLPAPAPVVEAPVAQQVLAPEVLAQPPVAQAPVAQAPLAPAPVVEPAPPPASPPPAAVPAAAAAAPVEAPPPPRAEPAAESEESRWVAPPPAEARPSGRKSSVGLLFVAVVIIAAAGVLGYMRWSKSKTQAPAPEPNTPAAGAKPTSEPEPAETAKPDAKDEPTAAASASAAPEASASASAAASAAEVTPPKDPKTLPATIGYLVVRTKSAAVEVLDNGKKVGAVNEAIEIPCTGSRFISLGETLPNGVKPVGEGRSMKIECQAVTTVELP